MSMLDKIYTDKVTIQLLIAELHRNLDFAFNKSGKRPKQLWPVSRNGLTVGLMAVALFCERLEGFDAYAQVFAEFASVLSDLDRGVVHPLLTPKGRKGSQHRPSEPTDLWSARCRVAIAVKYLMSAGHKKSEIARNIARHYQNLKWLMHQSDRRAKLSSSIINWYEAFSKGSIKNQEARDLYRTFSLWLSSTRKTGTLSAQLLQSMAHRQLSLAEEFKPITEEEVLNSTSLFASKRVFVRRSRRVNRDRGN